MEKIPKGLAVVFILALLSSVGVALWNISAKKIKIHTNVDEIFVKNKPNDWKEHLNNRHLRLREIYSEANKLLNQKASLTRWAFILFILSVLLLSIMSIFYG